MKILMTLLIFFSSHLYAGVVGFGNTGDITVQFELAKQSAIQILKRVRSAQFVEHQETEQDIELLEFYNSCRTAMYRGALKTKIEVVPSISDHNSFHALARRLNDTTLQVSRAQMEKLNEQKDLSPATIVAIFLHEVGHDCEFKGKPVNDHFDPLLNRLATKLIKLSNSLSQSEFAIVNTMDKIKRGQQVTFTELPFSIQKIITASYLNYMGEWVYMKFENQIPFRPTSANYFYSTGKTSVFEGWSEVPLKKRNQPELVNFVRGLLEPTFEAQTPSMVNGFTRAPIFSSMDCDHSVKPLVQVDFAKCFVNFTYEKLEYVPLYINFTRIRFTFNLFGDVNVQKISNW